MENKRRNPNARRQQYEEVRRAWLRLYLDQLRGATIEATGVADDGSPILSVRVGAKRYTVTVSRDAEGNGPGFLHGLPPVRGAG